ncbi:biotin--[acetyl-CoA-carboxylase] ligase [Mycetocola tolaasinivorans]|uniref:biotin--[biotin carboxyl-carrier protein] ligase n=1 Tax=Mycetocola tolaasinivorans TaxID=76635 RepID=A0A3L7A9B3_9MICO|nr:biotin--[acetyl-CoA-carboxylase] ligase [Mycetocola tolaasinivorans]RLP75972.1 biotin--[acetyl-CoA-carboxylase] ligase [Mycetocola tolaasinivorans]
MTADAPLLPRSTAIAQRLRWVSESGSTNADLLAAATADSAQWPHFSVLLTDTQVAGRGRLDRAWSSPSGSGLAISLLIRPAGKLPMGSYGWLSLLAGTAMAEAVNSRLSAAGVAPDARVKWPNDVLVAGKKICGVLAEITADASVVIGTGINTAMTAEQLPVDTATSLAVLGADPDADALLHAYLTTFAELYDALVASGGDAEASGLRRRVEARCDTLGRSVRVELPGGRFRFGRAERLDRDGRIVILDTETGERDTVSAGDITHLRTQD